MNIQEEAAAEGKTLEQQVREAEKIIRRQAEKINKQEAVIRTQSQRINEQQDELGHLVQQVEELGGQLEDLCGQVEKLQEKTSKNSSNSSLPPSSDRFVRQKKTRSLRKRSGKKPGGQKGHQGTTLSLVANPDQTVFHKVSVCDYCSTDLGQVESIRTEQRQVISLPVKRREVIEHQNESKCCPRCNTITVASFPEEVKAAVQYGADIGAVALYLSCQQLQPIGRTAQILADLLDCPMSGGTIQRMIERCAEKLVGIEEQIKQALMHAEVTHNDESGCYIAGKRVWWHSCSTGTLTHYAVHAKRGREATDAIGILPAFRGISVHDDWVTYWSYETCEHGSCNVHHLRNLKYEAEEKGQTWAGDLMNVLLEMKEAVQEAQAKGERSVQAERRAELLCRYEQAIAAGYAANPPPEAAPLPKRGKRKQSSARNLLDRLCKHREAVLRFLDNFAVSFDNNLAERDIRMLKVKQKISGCFRSEAGAQAFARIRGYLSTLHKQGKNLLLSLEQALLGYPVVPDGLQAPSGVP